MNKAPRPKHFDAKMKQEAIPLTADDAVKRIWEEFWVPLFETDNPSLQQIKDELAGYYFIMIQASLVYQEVTGGELSNVNYLAKDVLTKYLVHVEKMAKEMKQKIYADLEAQTDNAGEIHISEIAEYLEVDKK